MSILFCTKGSPSIRIIPMKGDTPALQLLPFYDKLSHWNKLLLFLASLLVYFLLYHFLPSVLTSATTISSLLPIVVGAYLNGIPGALIAGTLVFPLSYLSLFLKGETDILTIPRLVIIPVVLLVSFIAGLVRRLLTKSLYDQELLRIGSMAAQEGLWDLDLVGETTYYSPRWFSLLGLDEGEMPHTFETFKSLIHPDDLQQTLDSVQSITVQRQTSFSNTFRMKHKDGSWRWILSRGIVAARDKEGRITRMVGGTHGYLRAETNSEYDGISGLSRCLNRPL
jgi:PAS domain-containing protein